MTPQDFEYLSNIIRNRSGINLEEDKKYLIESRLQAILKKYSFTDLSEIVNQIKSTQNEQLIYDVVDALTTNETLFLRDSKVFEQLNSNILPEIFSQSKNKVRIWSAACSTGQEPYSLTMLILENNKINSKNFEIIASDLSEKVLEKAKKGEYTQFEVQRGLPVAMLTKYFNNENEQWYIKSEIKSYVQFFSNNLVNEYKNISGEFDIIFCRNVLIYFTNDTKVKVISKLASKLKSNGILVLGSAESLYGADELFKCVDNGIGMFQKK